MDPPGIERVAASLRKVQAYSGREVPFRHGMQDHHKLEAHIVREMGGYYYRHKSAVSMAFNLLGHEFSEFALAELLSKQWSGRHADVTLRRETSELLNSRELGYHGFSNHDEVPQSYHHTLHYVAAEITAALAMAEERRAARLTELPRDFAIEHSTLESYLSEPDNIAEIVRRTRSYINAVMDPPRKTRPERLWGFESAPQISFQGKKLVKK